MRFRNLLVTALLSTGLFAQVPQAFDFQAVARDASGNVLGAQALSVRLTVRSGTAVGPIAYREVHAVTTSPLGLFSVAVGAGSVELGLFTEVQWAAAPHFLQVELDATGGSTYTDMGTTQLLSVPYALHAGSVTCPTVSLLGDTLKQGDCFVIVPGISAANGGCKDYDDDGYYDQAGCNTPVDCNDSADFIHPNAPELCATGFDEDCNGLVDDNPDPNSWLPWHPDADGDGFGSSTITVAACSAPPGHILNDDDCDDGDPLIFPGQGCGALCTPVESAWVDANFEFYRMALMDVYGLCFFQPDPVPCMQENLQNNGVPLSEACNTCAFTWVDCLQQNCLGPCVQGPENCLACGVSSGCTAIMVQCFGLTDADSDGWPAGSDCNEADPDDHPGAPEVCDGADNNCNGAIDEGNVCNNCLDEDEDGYTTCDGDCDDSDPGTNPETVETCNGVDDNCDGIIDESCPDLGSPCDGPDADACANGTVMCDGNGGCTCLEAGPGNTETCDNGVDDDCDGAVDEGCCPPPGTPCDDGSACTTDDVYDGLCNCVGGAPLNCDDGNPCTDDTCDPQSGCVHIPNDNSTCDDGNPNTLETCVDGICVSIPICTDADQDGFFAQPGCGTPVDCNDFNQNIRPGALEFCNGIDDDCDGQVDEGGVCP